jgi:hypothetical protein
MKLFAGLLMPDSGVASCMPAMTVQLVGDGVRHSNELLHDTLRKNLIYGVNKHSRDLYTDSELWLLCKRCGMSASLIGEQYTRTWADQRLEPAVAVSRIHLADLSKTVLVRALLRRPNVLLLNHITDTWPAREQSQLTDLVRSYLDGTLLVDKRRTANDSPLAPISPRTVVWTARDSVLASALEDDDLVITLETCSTATLQTAKTLFGRDTSQQAPLLGASSAGSS